MKLPERFVELAATLGLGDLPVSLETGVPEVSVRVNLSKGPGKACSGDGVPWCPSGFYLAERPAFTLDPRLHQGLYYVQEGASMFHSHVVRYLSGLMAGPLRVLDACAAPGGKTTAVADVLPAGSVVVANEYVPARAAVLRENIIKWGLPSAIVTRGDTASLAKLRGMFDIVVADVPCSGEGMMRKDPEAVAQWSERLVEECARRQWEIVGNLWKALRPGGFMVYSTCTFNRSENEEIVGRILDELGGESVEIPVEASWGITAGIDTEAFCYRFIPGRTRGEGLFVSVISKDGCPSAKARSAASVKKGKTPPVPASVREWICSPEDYMFMAGDGRVTAFPAAHAGLLSSVGDAVDIIHEGVTLATLKGKSIVPAHSLAMSSALRRDAFPSAAVDLPGALAYLHGETPRLPESVPAGYVMLTYEGEPLGFVKNLGQRANSLYPAGWRIRRNVNNV